MFAENWVTALSVATLAGASVAFLYMLFKARGVLRAEREAGEILHGMMTELSSRLNEQDVRLVDHQVRLDVVELRLVGVQAVPTARGKEMHGFLMETKRRTTPVVEKEQEVRTSELRTRPTDTESRVLEALRAGPLTPRQLQTMIGKSREHTARLLKKMFESGLVTRNASGRPFVYELIEKGPIL